MKTNVASTSITAYRNLPVKHLATQADRICDLVTNHCNTWGGDLSLKEIKGIYGRLYGEIEVSTISARVNALVAAGRLERLDDARKCSVTGINVLPVRPARQ